MEKWNGKFGWSLVGRANRLNAGVDEKWLRNELFRRTCDIYGLWWWWWIVWEKNGGSGGGGGIRRESMARFSRNRPIDAGEVMLLVRANSWI